VLGVYSQTTSMFDTWQDRGINTLFETNEGANVDQWSAAAEQRGLYMIRHPSSNLQDDLNNPYLLAWAQPDEPSNTSSTVDYGKVAYDPAEIEAIAAPWRAAADAAGIYMPVVASHVGTHIFPTWADNSAIMHDYMEGSESDWLNNDSYPIQFGRNMLYDAGDYTSTEMGISTYKQVEWSDGKSVMTFLATSPFDSGQDVPTPAQLKAQAWSAIINGSEGILYFTFGLTPTFDWDASPPELVAAMTELNQDIASIDSILMSETTGGRDPYTVFHAANQGAQPKTGQLPFPFEAAEIQNEQGTYRIILNLSDKPAVLDKPEWNLDNVTFAPYEVKKGFFGGETGATDGNDTLTGDAGNNVMDGGAGADILRGMAGNDTYVVDNAGDTVDEGAAGSNGIDTVQSSVSFSLEVSARLRGTVENLTLTGSGDINATGNALDNVLVGNSGDNVIIGGAGADDINGGAGVDTASYITSRAGVTVNLSTGVGSGGDAQGDTLVAIENLTGSRYADTLTGNSGANVLRDSGGAGDDLRGLGGDDLYQVYSSKTVISEAAGGGEDRVMAGVDYALGAAARVEILTTNGSKALSAIDLTGNDFSQTIWGNYGDNRIDGKGGADTLKGLAGEDTFVFSTDPGAGNVDQIGDFKSGVDTIEMVRGELSGEPYTALPSNASSGAFFWASATGQAHDSNDRIIYNTATGALYYDADGNGAGTAVQFATLTGAPDLGSADFRIV